MVTSLKRLAVELMEDLIPEYKSINIMYQESKTIVYINNITITMNSDYPFRPPTVTINNLPYYKFVVPPMSKRISEIIHNETRTCLCCCSIIKNPSLWSVAHRVKDILEEITKINALKTRVKYTLAIADLCNYMESIMKQNVDKHIEQRILEYL
jgi:ubiquitin-protein ligase